MKQLPSIVAAAALSSCASTSTVAPPPERIAPIATAAPAESVRVPVQGTTGPVTVATPEPPEIHRISLYLGGRGLRDSTFWEPAETQGVFGVEYAQEHPDNWIGWEVGSLLGVGTGSVGPTDVTSSTGELYGGVRKTFGNPQGRWHPYIGGGLSLIRAGVEIGSLSEDASSAALYAHGGILLDISEGMHLGLDLRGLFGSKIDLPSFVSSDADYTQLALVLGWNF